jgi:hypothetical protein
MGELLFNTLGFEKIEAVKIQCAEEQNGNETCKDIEVAVMVLKHLG